MTEQTLKRRDILLSETEAEGPAFALLFGRRAGEKLSAGIRALAFGVFALALFITFFHVFLGPFPPFHPYALRFTSLSLLLSLCILTKPLGRRSWQERPNALFVVDVLIVLFLLGVTIYVVQDPSGFVEKYIRAPLHDIVIGTIYLIIVVECVRRTLGWILVGLTVFFLLQNILSPWLPGPLGGPAVSWNRVVEIIFMGGTGVGLFGDLVGLLADFLLIFLIFVAMLQYTGASAWFIRLAMALTGRFAGGPAKVAIVASAFLGTVTGSPAANVVGTGSITIPMMKRYGFRPEFAAGVEATSSAGAQFVPPVMGLAAFVIVTVLGISYFYLMLVILPVVFLYYYAEFMQVHFEAQRLGLRGLPKEELPRLWPTLKDGWPYLVPIGVLVYMMARALPLQMAAYTALVTVLAVSFLKKETRPTPEGLLNTAERGAHMGVEIACALSVASILTGTFYVSGLNVQIAPYVSYLAGENLLAVAALTALASLILGLELPTVIIYMVMFTTTVPILTKMGVNTIAANLFPFYFGVLATLTPPVAISAYVAAGIARANFLKSGLEAFKLALAGFMIPFMFLFGPALVLQGPLSDTVFFFVTAVIGITMLAGGLQGYFFGGPVSWRWRPLFLASGVTLMLPLSVAPTLIGLAGAMLASGYNLRGILAAGVRGAVRRRAAGPKPFSSPDSKE